VLKLDYVRVGYTEALDGQNSDEEFWSLLRLLSDAKARTGARARIGVKLLLSEKNKEKLVQRIERLLREELANHIKVKSLRSEDARERPSLVTIRRIEDQLASLREVYGAPDLQVDLKPARVKTSYKCWISPVMSVISANGDVLLCCNFYDQTEQLRIGSLAEGRELRRFSDFWGSARHMKVMREVQVDRVCNSCLGVDCRLVHYQDLCEPHVRGARVITRQEAPIFDGHSKLL